MSVRLVDLHCHILPGIDDGAKNIDIAVELLRQEQACGVTGVMFTPHFYYERDRLDAFAERREKAFIQTKKAAESFGIACKSGAEVYFSPALPSLDLEVLAFEGTRYVLIELPMNHRPSGVDEVLYGMRCCGYTPIIAHVERYPYVTEDPTLLYGWISDGAMAHINAAPLARGGKMSRIVKKYIDWGLVQFICTDAHSPDHRPANLSGAYNMLPADTASDLMEMAESVFLGEDFYVPEPQKPRRFLGRWI